MSARGLAAQVLLRVLKEDAYGAAALSAELSRSALSSRDRALATEITYGVLRTDKHLRRRLGQYAKVKESDLSLLVHLLVAAYQIEFLDRVPARAAVHEAVELIGQSRDSRVAGFANAILRRLAEAAEKERVPLREAVYASAPSWLRKRLIRDVGEDAADSLLVPGRAPLPTIRVNGPSPSSSLLSSLSEFLEEDCEPVAEVPNAYRYIRGGDPRRRPEYEAGEFVVQELGAQLIGHALGVMPGDRVLDVCAGRGQKTSLLKSQAGALGTVVATDVHEHKVRALQEEMNRQGHEVQARAWDFTTPPPPEFLDYFDRVLVDAPCSGVGTLARRPEILRRLGPEDPARLAELQLAILRQAALTLRPGGTLLFATCSVLSEEGENVIAALLGSGGGLPFSLVEDTPSLSIDSALFPGGLAPSSSLRLLPKIHGTDGYFAARLRRPEAGSGS
jgi:16S rRNA (cytosine967-C5)-methyltransferase